MNDQPQPVTELVDVLAAMPGTVAVVLGGSPALGSNDAGSDWDLPPAIPNMDNTPTPVPPVGSSPAH